MMQFLYAGCKTSVCEFLYLAPKGFSFLSTSTVSLMPSRAPSVRTRAFKKWEGTFQACSALLKIENKYNKTKMIPHKAQEATLELEIHTGNRSSYSWHMEKEMVQVNFTSFFKNHLNIHTDENHSRLIRDFYKKYNKKILSTAMLIIEIYDYRNIKITTKYVNIPVQLKTIVKGNINTRFNSQCIHV